MGYKTILVNFTSEEQAEGLLNVATQLAHKNGAHLIGLFAIPDVQVNPSVVAYIPAELLSSHKKYHREVGDKVKALFEKQAKSEGLSAEWRQVESATPSIAHLVTEHSQMADLVILGQVDEEKEDVYVREVPGQVLLECGRPVLMVPYAGQFNSIGETVLVAWNGKREAARAAFDALPFLTAAKKVRLHWFNPETHSGDTPLLPGTELAATLARHGVSVEVENTVNNDISVGDGLLSIASDRGADLLVMGGYGHSRTREFIFGGATRHILEHMTIPVLMSH